MASRLGQHLLEQNLGLKTLGYLFFIPAIFYSAPWLPNDMASFLAVIEETVLLT